MNLRSCGALSALALTGSLLAVAAPSEAASFCYGHRATIVGTSGDDTIAGTARRDVIVTLGGSDQIDGRGGDDVICAGNGDDRLYGSSGNDVLLGEGGADSFHDGTGNDVVKPGPSTFLYVGIFFEYRQVSARGFTMPGVKDVVHADPGNDKVTGSGYLIDFSAARRGVRLNMTTGVARGTGRDTIRGAQDVVGSRYADRVIGSKLQDVIETGRGRDTITAGAGGDVIDGGAGRDVIAGGDGSDFVFLFQDAVDLGAGPDFAFAFRSDVKAGDGDDVVLAVGSSSVSGGLGSDTVALQSEDFDAAVIADLNSGLSSTGATFSGVESLEGGEGNDVLTGDANANTLVGGNGDDVLAGGAGNDSLLGNEGEDSADGGDGTDTCNAELETGCE